MADCPECSTPMEEKLFSREDSDGVPYSYSREECPECGTVVHDDGSIITPEWQSNSSDVDDK